MKHGTPVQNPEHPFCSNMACPICTKRCYDDGFPGHLLWNDEPRCGCGKYSREEIEGNLRTVLV